MDRDRVLELQRNAMADWVAAMAESSEDASLFDRDGVRGVAVPGCPNRSIANSAVYSDTARMLDSLDDLAAHYDDAGIEAWTVWAPEFDEQAIAGLDAAGHNFDGKPLAMALDLKRWEAPDIGDLDWDDEGEAAELARINDAAYGFDPDDGMGRALALKPDSERLYRARIDGETACVLGTIDHAGGDLGFYFVATHPDHRGLGLTTRLMTVALEDARERGFETSTLQGSAMGEPVYRRLGYEGPFRLHMYERRKTTV